MEIKHKTYNLDFVLPEITQGTLEQFEKFLEKTIEEMGSVKLAVFNGGIVRAAIAAGWVDISLDEIPNMPPGKITYLSGKITKHVEAARQVAPE